MFPGRAIQRSIRLGEKKFWAKKKIFLTSRFWVNPVKSNLIRFERIIFKNRFLKNYWTDLDDLTTVLKGFRRSKQWPENRLWPSSKVASKWPEKVRTFFELLPKSWLAHLKEQVLVSKVAKYQENRTRDLWEKTFQTRTLTTQIGIFYVNLTLDFPLTFFIEIFRVFTYFGLESFKKIVIRLQQGGLLDSFNQ